MHAVVNYYTIPLTRVRAFFTRCSSLVAHHLGTLGFVSFHLLAPLLLRCTWSSTRWHEKWMRPDASFLILSRRWSIEKTATCCHLCVHQSMARTRFRIDRPIFRHSSGLSFIALLPNLTLSFYSTPNEGELVGKRKKFHFSIFVEPLFLSLLRALDILGTIVKLTKHN